MLLMLSVHSSRRSDLLCEDKIEFSPKVQARDFKDAFGNICTRLVPPTGLLEIRNEFIIADSGQPDIGATDAEQWPIDALPDDALTYLLGSRYCDTQKLSNHAWSLFGHIQGGWARARAICQYVHDRIQFGYPPLGQDRPRDARQLVGECSCQNIVMQPLRCGPKPRSKAMSGPICRSEQDHPGALHEQCA
jgi:transglutaminase-like putative cysteine protease